MAGWAGHTRPHLSRNSRGHLLRAGDFSLRFPAGRLAVLQNAKQLNTRFASWVSVRVVTCDTRLSFSSLRIFERFLRADGLHHSIPVKRHPKQQEMSRRARRPCDGRNMQWIYLDISIKEFDLIWKIGFEIQLVRTTWMTNKRWNPCWVSRLNRKPISLMCTWSLLKSQQSKHAEVRHRSYQEVLSVYSCGRQFSTQEVCIYKLRDKSCYVSGVTLLMCIQHHQIILSNYRSGRRWFRIIAWLPLKGLLGFRGR